MNKPNPLHDDEKQIIEERQFTSGRISDTARYIAFGTLAAIFSMLMAEPKSEAHILLVGSKGWFFISAECSALALIFDYFQYVTGYRSASLAAGNRFVYSKKWTSYKLRTFFYYAKQILVILSAVIFMLLIALHAFGAT